MMIPTLFNSPFILAPSPFTMLFHQQQARQSALSNYSWFFSGYVRAHGNLAIPLPLQPSPLPLAAGETRAGHGL